MFLKEVVPQVEYITILSASELRVVFARRFPNVKKVVVGCLFRYPDLGESIFEDDHHYEFDFMGDFYTDRGVGKMTIDCGVVTRIVPFLTVIGPSLKRVEIGGIFISEQSEDRMLIMEYFELGIENDRECNEKSMVALDLAMAGAFASGAIPNTCTVRGADFSPCGGYTSAQGVCEKCKTCSESNPIEEVAPLVPPHCISARFCLETLTKRRGGREYLRSHKYWRILCTYPRRGGAEELAKALKRLDLVPKIDRQTFVGWLKKENRKYFNTTKYPAQYDFLVSVGMPVLAADMQAPDDGSDDSDEVSNDLSEMSA